MRLVFLFSIFFYVLGGHCQTSDNFQNLISTYQKSEILNHAQWSLCAEDVQNGQSLLDYNSDKSMAPASGLKLFTSAAALEILGADFQFKTELYYDGEIDEQGVLQGNIYIRGGGDPTLGSDMVDGSRNLAELMHSWLEALMIKGITSINGSIKADATLFEGAPVPGNWLWIDLGNYYGSGVSALSITDNLYRLFFKPGEKPGLPAKVLRTEPHVTDLQFDNHMLTGEQGSGDNGYIYRAPNANIATLRGTIPAGVTEFSIKGSLPNPALYTANYFKNHLQKNGMAVHKDCGELETPPQHSRLNLIYTTLSPRLSEIIEVLNKRSVNHIAEQLLFYLAVDSVGIGSREIGLQRIERFLKRNKINTSALHLEDGSGLSPNDMISSKMMVDLLKAMHSKKSFQTFYNSLALAGDPDDLGFFKNFGRNTIIEKKCRIKSGLIQGVRSHSGYLTTKSGRLISFAFIANHLTGPYAQVDQIHRDILIRLAERY